MKLLGDIFTTFVNKILLLAISVGVASATAWLLGPEGRGELSIAIVFGTLLVLGLGFGVEMGCAYYAGNAKQPINRVFGTQILAFLMTSGLIVVVGFLILNSSVSFVQKIPTETLKVSIFYAVAYMLFTYLNVMFMGIGRLLEYNLALTIEQLLTLCLIVFLCLKSSTSENAMIAHAAGTFTVGGWLIYRLIKTGSIRGITFSWSTTLSCYRYGIKYYFAKLVTLANVQMGVIIISFLGTVTQAGLFSAGLGLISRMWIIPDTFNTVLLSRVLKNEEELSDIFVKACRSTILVMLLGGLILVPVIKPMIRIILSPDFLPVIIPILVLLPGVIMRSYYKILASYFNGMGRPEINSIILVVSLVLNISLMIVLLPVLNITGAAIATSFAYMVEGLLAVIFFCRLSRSSLRHFIPTIADILFVTNMVYYKIVGIYRTHGRVS